LTELALDLRWSWHHGADELWRQLDPELWTRAHNPWVLLQVAAPSRIRELLTRPTSRTALERLLEQRRAYRASPAWFQQSHPQSALTRVAYFSMEFALSEALPIYSGGLGNVAGDQLKAASDLAVPVVGVGLLYQQGYFRQVIDVEGGQEALYPYNDPAHLPITPARGRDGEWLRVPLELPGSRTWLRAWQVQVGRVDLYLLDSNDPANPPALRGIASELYGGGSELRLRQELMLGIGGWRLLRALGLAPEVCHLNEGHAAFAVLERARTFMQDSGQPFETALAVTRAGNLFTTHTPVPAGFDRYEPALIERYLGAYAETDLRIGPHQLLALGRRDPADSREPFNMAYLAIRGSGAINGVSRLHGVVSRRLFQPLFPRWPAVEVPVGHVTNGVHTPSWDSAEADQLWTSTCGAERWRGSMETVTQDVAGASEHALWAMRSAARKALVAYVRERMASHAAACGAPPDEAAAMCRCLDPDALTLGFARRFAIYKRPGLLLHDPVRLLGLLCSADRPVQLVIAGKAHPADQAGQDLIRAWIEFIRRPEVRGRVVFLPDYDMLAAEQLVQGVDLWINTPRRPWEASGTSGMKVLVNGGLNLSELDGWWAEAYSPDVGWALGDGREHGDDPAWDAAEAEALYDLLEREVVPAFYTRDARGIPARWIAKMRASMARLTPRFSANRVVREYTETYYLPAAAAYQARAANQGKLGAQLVAWRRAIASGWSGAAFGRMSVETRDFERWITVQVHLGGLDPTAVCVELYAEARDGGEPERHEMQLLGESEEPGAAHQYCTRIPTTRTLGDYTARVRPHNASASVPLEAPEILWQR
jgi:starch phosphorylase